MRVCVGVAMQLLRLEARAGELGRPAAQPGASTCTAHSGGPQLHAARHLSPPCSLSIHPMNRPAAAQPLAAE